MEKQKSDHENDKANPTTELRHLWINWLITLSKSIQPVVSTAIIFGVYILGDLFVVFLAGFAFSDIIQNYSFVRYVYDGIKFGSVIVITFHFMCEYLIELNKNKKIFEKIFRRPASKQGNAATAKEGKVV